MRACCANDSQTGHPRSTANVKTTCGSGADDWSLEERQPAEPQSLDRQDGRPDQYVVGRRGIQSSQAAALDRFFACFGTVGAAESGAQLPTTPQAASKEPVIDKQQFAQITTNRIGRGFIRDD